MKAKTILRCLCGSEMVLLGVVIGTECGVTVLVTGRGGGEGKNTLNDDSHGRNGSLDNKHFKGLTYLRSLSFNEICVGMKYKESLKAFSFGYIASSLYSLIADGKYRPTQLGRNKWKSLISGSSLQYNCNKEGLNVYNTQSRVRLGLLTNEQDDCNTPDSFIGLGAHWNGR